MDFLLGVWQLYLYQPLVNVLVYIYNTYAQQNLGWAVVYLTILLRLVLLPFSIISERNKMQYEHMEEDLKEAERYYRADPIYLKQYVRYLARKYKIRPWAKTVVLFIQLLVLVLLYQVFITGIQGTQLARILYSGVEYPGKLNTIFFTWQYGSAAAQNIAFNLGERSLLWPALVGLVLIIDIVIHLRLKKSKIVSSEWTYLFVFPIASFLLLWYLPMVKSIFILTSLAFSYVLSLMRVAFFRNKKSTH